MAEMAAESAARVPAYEEHGVAVYVGDVRDVLQSLDDQCVDCVVTSPPYWGLRDYGTAMWEGGAADCAHAPDAATLERHYGAASTLVGTTGHQKQAAIARHRCHCGATRIDAQLGLEPTPDEYVANLVAVFREVRRVLRDDGTLWLNMGDCYASSVNGTSHARDGLAALGERYRGRGHRNSSVRPDNRTFRDKPFSTVVGGLKQKDLVGMPWRVAFALQADGWYLRADIIWAKPNPMPESVRDRPTKAHEYVFLLTKQPRYYYDADAVREPNASPQQRAHNERYARPYATYDQRAADTGQPGNVNNVGIHARGAGDGRNRRSVWNIATQPYPDAHFATFPERLVEPCVRAGSRVGGVVLDPFAGSGTTLAVARREGRRSIGIDLNPNYVALIERRLERAVARPKSRATRTAVPTLVEGATMPDIGPRPTSDDELLRYGDPERPYKQSELDEWVRQRQAVYILDQATDAKHLVQAIHEMTWDAEKDEHTSGHVTEHQLSARLKWSRDHVHDVIRFALAAKMPLKRDRRDEYVCNHQKPRGRAQA